MNEKREFSSDGSNIKKRETYEQTVLLILSLP